MTLTDDDKIIFESIVQKFWDKHKQDREKEHEETLKEVKSILTIHKLSCPGAKLAGVFVWGMGSIVSILAVIKVIETLSRYILK